jgi:gamma-D-glutamyl-L-lysine dipeptidyl-peptidase
MDYAVISVPAAPVRRKPRHQSEMTNQLLFGETVKVTREKSSGWVKVMSMHDQYEGWMTRSQLQETPAEEAKVFSSYVAASQVNLIVVNNKSMTIPFGSSLPAFSETRGRIGDMSFSFEGTATRRDQQQPGPWLVRELATSWLNAPYLWGGRTILGVDCSGFVQVIYKMMGIDLPRDAWQQAQEGSTVKKLKDAQCGDLAFFDDKEEIVHVGILLNPEQIIHAAGKVRMDAIDKKGIVNSATGKRTHNLQAIKRRW